MRVNAFFAPKRTDIPDKECAWCGATFQPHNGKQIYCCRECKTERILADQHMRRRAAAERMKAAAPIRACVVCGGPVQDTNPNRKTCSGECAATLERTRKRIARLGNLDPITATCAVCGAEFEKINSAVTCSPACSRRRGIDLQLARERVARRGDVYVPQISGPSWSLNYDPYAEGMVFTGVDGATIPATSPQALPVY